MYVYSQWIAAARVLVVCRGSLWCLHRQSKLSAVVNRDAIDGDTCNPVQLRKTILGQFNVTSSGGRHTTIVVTPREALHSSQTGKC
ncbi:unnamed protein product [Danaus chrysippus]|uniref:(African queen) hypothetical protein n=1 Tax=Danaus chrysippus TaxID=151541 RepID=A0A8J2VYR7_9NEOP|nr:unnamed protein product [Danaus chrysippus]